MSPCACSKVQLPGGNCDLPEPCVLLQFSSNAFFFSPLDALKSSNNSTVTGYLAPAQPKDDCVCSGGGNFPGRKIVKAKVSLHLLWFYLASNPRNL